MSIFQERLKQALDRPNLEQVLLSKCQRDGDGCLIWQGSKSPKGYGKYNSVEVHKLWYILHNGPVPLGTVLAHSCHKKACLICARPLTQGDNIRETTQLITHCPWGHEYTPVNTARGHKGERVCRQCRNRPYTRKKRLR